MPVFSLVRAEVVPIYAKNEPEFVVCRQTGGKARQRDRHRRCGNIVRMLDPLRADVTISARDLARSRRRAASAASAAAFGVAALILAAGFIDWIFLAMRDA